MNTVTPLPVSTTANAPTPPSEESLHSHTSSLLSLDCLWNKISTYALMCLAMLTVSILAVGVIVACVVGGLNPLCGVSLILLSLLMLSLLASLASQVRGFKIAQKLDGEVKKLEKENLALQQEVDRLTAANKELETLIGEFTHLHHLFQDYGDKLMMSGNNLAATAEEFKNHLSNCELKLQAILSPLQHFLNSVQTLSSEASLSALSTKIQELLAQSHTLEASIDTLQATAQCLQANVAAQEEQIKDLRKEKELLKQIISDLKGTANFVDQKIKLFSDKVFEEENH